MHVLLTAPCLARGQHQHHRPSAVRRSGWTTAAPPTSGRGPCGTQPGEHGEGATGDNGVRRSGRGGRRERRDGRCARDGVAPPSPTRPGQPYPVRPVESAPGTTDTRHQTPRPDGSFFHNLLESGELPTCAIEQAHACRALEWQPPRTPAFLWSAISVVSHSINSGAMSAADAQPPTCTRTKPALYSLAR